MWKLIKWLFFLAIMAALWLAITGQKFMGKTIEEHLEPYIDSKLVKEGIKDLRQLVGEGLKAAGEAISEDVTEDERKQLDELVRQELLRGKPIQMAPGQEALPPRINKEQSGGQSRSGRPTVEEMEAMPKALKPIDDKPTREEY